MKTLDTGTTEERRARMKKRMEKDRVSIVGSAYHTCPDCGMRFPDTGGYHWPGHCLLRLRRIAAREEGDSRLALLFRISSIESKVEREINFSEGIKPVHGEIGTPRGGRPEFEDFEVAPNQRWYPDGRMLGWAEIHRAFEEDDEDWD